MNAGSNWRNDPPTEKQFAYLRSIFINIDGIRTKGEASDIIEMPHLGTPVALDEFRAARPQIPRSKSNEEMRSRVQGWQDKFVGQFGHLRHEFKKPLQRQVREVIDHLDETNPGWDLIGPEHFPNEWRMQLEDESDQMFLVELERCFPELRKPPRTRRAAGLNRPESQANEFRPRLEPDGKSGCLLLLCPVFVLIGWWLLG